MSISDLLDGVAYGELLALLRKDLQLDASTDILPGSINSAAASHPLVTSLPSGAVDGQIVDYLADATKGVIWRLRYRAASTSAHKWEYVGGPPLVTESTTNFGSTNSAVYTSTPSGGTLPSITVPLVGDYDVEPYTQQIFTDTAPGIGMLSYQIGGTAASDSDALFCRAPAAGGNIMFSLSFRHRKTDLAAGTVLQMMTRVSGGGLVYPNGNGTDPIGIRIVPVRVG